MPEQPSQNLITLENFSSQTPKLTLNPQFKTVLANMKTLTKEYHQLVDNVDLDQLNETELNQLTKKLAPMQSYYKEIVKTKKQMRKLFNDQRDQITNQLDHILNINGMDQLTEMDATKKQLRKDLLNHHANRRWTELKSTFDANFEAYPQLKQLAPQLADFGNFRIQHADLVSGAKTKPITDKQRQAINQIIAEWNQDVTAIHNNDAHLSPESKNNLLQQWLTNPHHDNYLNLTTYYQSVDEQQKQQQYANDQAKVQAANRAIQQGQTTPKPTSQNEFDWLLSIALSNPNTHNLTQDDAKASMIVMLSVGMTNPKSIYFQHIGRDYEKMLRAVQYILTR